MRIPGHYFLLMMASLLFSSFTVAESTLAVNESTDTKQTDAKSTAAESTAKKSTATQSTDADAQSTLTEVVIVGDRESNPTVITAQTQKMVDVPGTLGDPIAAAFSLPGVIAGAERGPGGGGPAVRGSSPSDNRYIVDGMPTGYVFHTFYSNSVFNENIIQDFQLYSAGFGPRYSNAIGGVFDIKLRDPKQQKLATTIDLGMLRSGIFLEGGVTEHAAFYLSARHSMIHLFIDDATKDDVEKEDGIRLQQVPQDSDYQFKTVYDLNDTNQIKLSINGATDTAEADFSETSVPVLEDPDFGGEAKIDNIYQNQAVSWHSFIDADTALVMQLGQYVNKQNWNWGDAKYYFRLKNTDSFLLSHFDFLLGSHHNLSIGGELHQIVYSYDTRFIEYICTETDPDCLSNRGDLVAADDDMKVNELMFYINDHWEFTDTLAFDIGHQIHFNNFTDETFSLPRLGFSWIFVKDWTLSSSLGKYSRFPDIDKVFPGIGNTDLGSPVSNHFTLGVKHEVGEGWSWTVTSYYKTMDDLPLAMGANATPNYTNNVSGEAYGVDLFVNKDLTERWYGWLALSASKSLRTNDLTSEEYNYYLDTPLVLNWVMSYKMTELWTAGSRLTLQTGRAYTPIIGAKPNPYHADHFAPVYGDAFSDRLPNSARLDLRFNRDITVGGYKGSVYIDILNALNRKNVEDRRLDYKKTTSVENYTLEDEVSMGIFPALGMSLTF